MNKYEQHKKVALPWLEEIPEHWELVKINILFEERREKVSDKDFEALSVTKMGVTKQLANVAKTIAGDNRKKVLKDDFVINSRSDRKGSSGVSNFDGSVSLINTVLKIRNGNVRFIHYLMRSVPFQEEFYKHGKGIVADLWSTNFQSMKNILLPIPSLYEQAQIADYLDWKISEIDRLIALEKEKIEKLNRLFEKIISFNSSNMKEESIRKYVDIVRGNSTFTKDDLLSKGTYVALQYGKVYKVDTIDNNYNFYVNDEFYKSSQIVDRNDIIAVYTSETIEDLGHFAFYDRDEKGLIGGEQLLIKPKEGIDPKYLFYCLKKDALLLKKASTGIKVYRFKSNDLKSIKIPVVSLNEQKKIVERIEKKLSKVKRNIDICNSIIGELNSFKYSLISEVVIGKIDVRSVVIPSYEKVDVDISTDEEEIEE